MKLCRFETEPNAPRTGMIVDASIVDLGAAGVPSLASLLHDPSLLERLRDLEARDLPRIPFSRARFLAPVDRQEVWAAGVTYNRSKTARMEESDFSARAYQHVYGAPRPELFFKSLPEKVVGYGDTVGLRTDARWSVPEPELALMFSPSGELVGYTIGNDMSSRDIEGENLLYLPQAKIYERSCALGPCVVVGETEEEVRTWDIAIVIGRDERVVFAGETSLSRMKRSFKELGDWLWRCQRFPHGVILLTGTGIVPPDEFTLEAGDIVRISISGIGNLENNVIRLGEIS